jgi:glycine/D-amino acid oxidase-like deaminating enzyme
MELSFWEKDTFFSNIDVTIAGSGIVGLSAALHLKKKNPSLKVLVVERGLLPYGASSKNAGFATFGSASELIDDLGRHTEEQVFGLVQRRWKGLSRLRKNLGDDAIDFRTYGGYEMFDDEKMFEQCEEKLDYLNKQLKPIIGEKRVFRVADKKIDKFGLKKVQHLIECVSEGQIDTGRMILALLQKVQKAGVLVVNGLNVEKVTAGDKVHISTGQIEFDTKRLLVATNGFARRLLDGYPVIPARAQVLITEPIPKLKIKGTFHFDKGYYYFRNIGKRLLFGGGRNLDFKAEETDEFGLTPLVQNKLEEMLRTIILPGQDFKIEHRWSGIMGVGPEKTTIIKQVDKNIFCSVRMGGMGVAIGSLVGEEGAKLVEESF